MFDTQPVLIGERVLVRPLTRADFEGLFAAAAHPEVWAGHPARNRYRREVFADYFEFLVEAGGAVAIVDRENDVIAGCSRYYEPPDVPGGMAIGFTFLNHAYWGGLTNLAVKRLMLGHVFRSYAKVWFHIDPGNVRSQRATEKLGAEHVRDALLDLAGKPTRWRCYRLTRARWSAVLARSG